MNLFFTYINTIKPGIDRIDINIPSLLYLPIWGIFGDIGKFKRQYEYKNYQYAEFGIYNCRLFLVKKSFLDLKPFKQSKVYIRVLNPTENEQLSIKNVLLSLATHYSINIDEILINQVEVKYDIYCRENKGGEVKQVLERHLAPKYSRKNCTKKCIETIYIANAGNIRLCTKGIRIYEKTNRFNSKFVRLEFQYNREYFYRKRLNILNFPLTSLSFDSFRNIDFLKDFSSKGIHALARSVVNNSIGEKLNDEKSKMLINEKKMELKKLILGNDNFVQKDVRAQNQAIVEIKKKHSIKFIQQRYIKPLSGAKQLIQCHADISTLENNVSKRMIFVQVGHE